MASEQTGTRKKQSRNLSREEHRHPVLYRHQDCIPNPKLLQNCERHSFLGLKNNEDFECHGKLAKGQETNDLKDKPKQLNYKARNDKKSEKIVEGPKINLQSSSDNLGNNEELSKSRKRRLRKQRLLVSLAPSLNNTKPSTPVENNIQTKSVLCPIVRPSNVVPPTSTASSNRASEPVKSSAKDTRKRPDKSVGSRNKSIKSKSLIEPTNQSKADIIKTLEEKTRNSLLQTLVPLNNSSPKKEKPSLPVFSFPDKRLNSSEAKVDKDGVFYFGETKHQLEKLTSGFPKYNTSLVQEKSEFAQHTELNSILASKLSNIGISAAPPFNFSPLSIDIINTLEAVKQNLFETGNGSPPNKVENKRVFPAGSSDYLTNESVYKSPVLKDLSQFPNHQVVNLDIHPVNTPSDSFSNNSDICKNSTIKTNNITKPTENTEHFCSPTIPIAEEEKISSQNSMLKDAKNSLSVMKSTEETKSSNKAREEVMLEREAKKIAKLAAKTKYKTAQQNKPDVSRDAKCKLEKVIAHNQNDVKIEDKGITSDRVILQPCGEIKEKTLTETMTLTGKSTISSQNTETEKDVKVADPFQESSAKSKADLRAERRAKQEAQRAAKAAKKPIQPQLKEKVVLQEKNEKPKPDISIGQTEKKPEVPVAKIPAQPKPKLFSHLYQEKTRLTSDKILKVGGLHPAIVQLGVQYAARVVVGSNARCVALLHALKQMVNDYTTPSEKEFSRGLEEELGPMTVYLNQCRPLSVSMTNALRHIKRTLTQLPNSISDIEARRKVCDVVDIYIHEQIDVAGEAISDTVKQKIAHGDVILTYGCSSLVYQILVQSHLSGTKFRVVVVDGLPWREGREMLRRLVDKGLSCTYVLITAASFIMREASKVLLGAHALLANGYVMSRAGSSQVALLAHCYNVPVLVCCETYKFSERVQTDAFVYNEMGELCCDNIKDKDKGRVLASLTPLSLTYDITPPDLVSAVVTELAILPCTSVPVILRIKPSESVM